MIINTRLVASLFSVAALASVPRASVRAQTSHADPVQACVRLDDSRPETPRLRIVADNERCRRDETHMFVVVSKTMPFVADGSAPEPPADTNPAANAPFVSRFLTTVASAPISARLLIDATLVVDTDRAMFSIRPPADVTTPVDGRGQPSSVSCVPLVDGQPAGALKRLSPKPRMLGLSPGVHVDPVTGRVDQTSPGYFPDTLWSRQEDFRRVPAGPHELAIGCQARDAFRFRGIGTITVLQRVRPE